MSAISSFVDTRADHRPASMSFRQVVAGFVSRFRGAALPDAADMPRNDRGNMRQSDYERCAMQYGSPWNEIRNQVGAWR